MLRVYADGTTPNEEVRCRYNISLVNGTVDITRREVTLTSASAVEVYTGGGTLSAESVTRTGDTWASGEEPSYTGYAALGHIGSIPNTFTINYVAGVNYTDNYTIHVVNGTLTYLGSSQDVVFTADAQEIADATSLVQGAIGYKRDRGDVVNVTNIKINRDAQFAEEDAELIRNSSSQSMKVMEWILSLGANARPVAPADFRT